MTPAPFVQSSSSSSLLAITSFPSFVTSLSSRCKFYTEADLLRYSLILLRT